MTIRYRQNPRCASRVFGGEAAVITPGNQRISILDPVATEIWALLETTPRTLEQLCAALQERYEGDPNTIQQDVVELLGALLELEAIERLETPGSE
ncbi:MAG: PqqD family protein [Bradymonadales bacterium]|nr:PqqD family protein [Bradymonadales bacterium]